MLAFRLIPTSRKWKDSSLGKLTNPRDSQILTAEDTYDTVHPGHPVMKITIPEASSPLTQGLEYSFLVPQSLSKTHNSGDRL